MRRLSGFYCIKGLEFLWRYQTARDLEFDSDDSRNKSGFGYRPESGTLILEYKKYGRRGWVLEFLNLYPFPSTRISLKFLIYINQILHPWSCHSQASCLSLMLTSHLYQIRFSRSFLLFPWFTLWYPIFTAMIFLNLCPWF